MPASGDFTAHQPSHSSGTVSVLTGAVNANAPCSSHSHVGAVLRQNATHNIRAGGEQAWLMVGRVAARPTRAARAGGRLGEASLPPRMAPTYFGPNLELLTVQGGKIIFLKFPHHATDRNLTVVPSHSTRTQRSTSPEGLLSLLQRYRGQGTPPVALSRRIPHGF
jgi:hypothetical protein